MNWTGWLEEAAQWAVAGALVLAVAFVAIVLVAVAANRDWLLLRWPCERADDAIGWVGDLLDERRHRRRLREHLLYNGHDMYISREDPNVPVELTCRLCGYSTTNLELGYGDRDYRPFSPIPEPCPRNMPNQDVA